MRPPCARCGRRRRMSRRTSARSSTRSARGGDAALRELAERFDPAGVAPDKLAVPAQEIEGALGWAEPEILDSLRVAIANVRKVADAQVHHGEVVERADRAVRRDRRGAGPARRRLRARRARRLSVDADHVRGHRAGAGCGGDRRVLAAGGRRRPGASDDPRRVRALRDHRGLPRRRGSGDRRTGVGDGVDQAGRRDRRAGKPVRPGGKAPGGRHGRHRQRRRPERAGGGRHRRRRSRS